MRQPLMLKRIDWIFESFKFAQRTASAGAQFLACHAMSCWRLSRPHDAGRCFNIQNALITLFAALAHKGAACFSAAFCNNSRDTGVWALYVSIREEGRLKYPYVHSNFSFIYIRIQTGTRLNVYRTRNVSRQPILVSHAVPTACKSISHTQLYPRWAQALNRRKNIKRISNIYSHIKKIIRNATTSHTRRFKK